MSKETKMSKERSARWVLLATLTGNSQQGVERSGRAIASGTVVGLVVLWTSTTIRGCQKLWSVSSPPMGVAGCAKKNGCEKLVEHFGYLVTRHASTNSTTFFISCKEHLTSLSSQKVTEKFWIALKQRSLFGWHAICETHRLGGVWVTLICRDEAVIPENAWKVCNKHNP